MNATSQLSIWAWLIALTFAFVAFMVTYWVQRVLAQREIEIHQARPRPYDWALDAADVYGRGLQIHAHIAREAA